MGQQEVLREYYLLYETDPKAVLSIKEVARRLGESYSPVNRQVRMLWFHGYLCLRHLEKRGKAFQDIPLFGKTAYRLNPGVINRCRKMFATENAPVFANNSQNTKDVCEINPLSPTKE